MEVSPLKKLEQLEYSLDSVTDLSSPSVSSSSPAVATFSCVDGVTELRFLQSDSTRCFNFDLASAQVDIDSHLLLLLFHIWFISFETFLFANEETKLCYSFEI